jgi:hypothetical protein
MFFSDFSGASATYLLKPGVIRFRFSLTICCAPAAARKSYGSTLARPKRQAVHLLAFLTSLSVPRPKTVLNPNRKADSCPNVSP